MGCCDGWDYRKDPDTMARGIVECPVCGEDCTCEQDSRGEPEYIAIEGCFHSPRVCKICGARPCDQSC